MKGGRSAIRVASAILLAAALAGCGGGGGGLFGNAPANRNEDLEVYTPEQIFERGEFELSRGRANDAAFYFAEIERLYPYSDWARRALPRLLPGR